MDFVHLHVHSHFSMLDGGNRIGELVKRAKAHGMSALAVTDHGNLHGSYEFYNTAREHGIKPILGMEAYISPTRRDDRTTGGISESSYHLLLLAMNETGWKNLMKLSSRAFLEGFYYRPRLDRELLAQFSEGLVCTTACLGGEVPSAFLQEQEAKARRIAGEYRDIFGAERFFIEIQNQGESEQDRVNPMLIRLARELGVGIVGTNDVHFLRREDKRSHEVLTCISMGKKLADLSAPDAMRYSQELYLKSPAEMEQAFHGWPEALENTVRIADMCNLEFAKSKHLPVFHAPDASTPEAYLRKLAWEGLAKRFGEVEPPEAYRKRLEWELKVIEDKGYSSYFLIVNDFVQFARSNNIPASPRGSGVATLLGYSLGIANVDPVRYGLLFERFTDPQRAEDPDVDIDICQDGRAKVIQYVREKYGHVAQIITYGTLKARAVLRDVGRVLDIPLDEVDRIAKLVPEDPKMTLQKALAESPDLKRMYDDPATPHVKQMVDHGQALEGLARHAGVHAAGVVVCDEPLENLIPLYRQSDNPDVITQWDGPTCEKAGMMKMDLLGLKTLTVIQRARELVRDRTGTDIDPDALPLDDQQVYALFRNGETDAVFQFESDGMKKVLKDMQPNRIEDLIAANAMYRPGPMDLIPTYSARKKNQQPVEKIHALVDDILAETYGIMVYQEQVMLVLNKLGQLPLNRALTLIKAISKKKEATINKERPAFLEGAKKNGVEAAEAERIFDLILKFAGYGFNKAHSTGYAIVAYQTAWFKRYHPREFWAATLTYESSDQDKIVQYMNDARRMDIEIAPPDINTSRSQFTVDGDRVRFGLMAVKGVGDAAVQAILAAREKVGRFKDLFHFCRSVDLRAVNRSTIEALIKCGAFDLPGAPHRRALVETVDRAIDAGQISARDRLCGQMNFFGDTQEAPDTTLSYATVPPWTRAEKLGFEKETLGFYVSSHPLDSYGPEIKGINWPEGLSIADFDGRLAGKTVTVGAMIASVRSIVTKSGRNPGQKMAFAMLEDSTGRLEAVVFPKLFAEKGELLKEGALVCVRGELDNSRGDKVSLKTEGIMPLEEAAATLPARLRIRLAGVHLQDADLVNRIAALLREHRGDCPVDLHVVLDDGRPELFIQPSAEWTVRPDADFRAALKRMIGLHNLYFSPSAPPPPKPRFGRPNDTNGNGGFEG